MSTDKQLEVLHDHYKETFARVRQVEASRDRFFLWLIGLYALLSLEIGYRAAVGRSLGTLSFAGAELDLGALPLPALLDATWVLTLAIALRYCQTAIWVDRHYPYVHLLEENISPLVRHSLRLHGNVYHREGRVYLSEYPMLLNVAWFAYVIVFPLVLLFATAGLLWWEWGSLPYHWAHLLFDTLIAVMLIVVFFLYRVQPYMAARWRKFRERLRQKKDTSSV